MTRLRTLGEIKKHLRVMGISPGTLEYVEKQVRLRDEKIESQAKYIEVQNRIVLLVSERFLEILYVDSASSKITINPATGRVTLKISDRIKSDKVIKDYHKLTDMVMVDDTLPAITMRGKIKYDENKYRICLSSESKKFTKNYEMQG
ncbi:MAG: hypothetical protein WC055_01140 [Melioribacteraceae bacterium]